MVAVVWGRHGLSIARRLAAGEVKVPVKGGEIPAYRAMPANGGPFPTVLVASEVWGVHEHIKDICRRLAKAGYFAIAPELFTRQGDPSKIADTQEIIAKIVKQAPTEQVMSDLDATVAYAKSASKADVARLAVTGFCWGGFVTWMYATHNPGLKAAVSWYGTDARFLSSPRAVKLAAKYADARTASQPNDGARNGHGCYLDEIFRPQNNGAVAETSRATDRAQDNPKYEDTGLVRATHSVRREKPERQLPTWIRRE